MKHSIQLARADADAPGRVSAPAGQTAGAPPTAAMVQQYKDALHRHLSGMANKEIDFFVNARRLDLLERLVGADLKRTGINILNVASGPFAIEFYLQLRNAEITSFDLEPRLAPLHQELAGSGVIPQSSFEVASIESFQTHRTYDVVLINDLFYLAAVDFYAVIDKYIGYVKPGGLLYFDIQDERAGPVWRAFGKEGNNRRYHLEDIARVLRSRGLMVQSTTPALGIKGGIDSVLRKSLWYTAGLANNFIFVARKSL